MIIKVIIPGSMSGEGAPYHVTYPMMHVMSPTNRPPCGQADACENITYPQLVLRAVSYPARLLSPATSTCSVSFFTVLLRQTSMMLVVIWKNWTIFDHWSLNSAKATIPLFRVSRIFSKSTFFISSSAVSAMNCLSS